MTMQALSIDFQKSWDFLEITGFQQR